MNGRSSASGSPQEELLSLRAEVCYNGIIVLLNLYCQYFVEGSGVLVGYCAVGWLGEK